MSGVKRKNRRPNKKDGLFDDLEDLSDSEIDEKISSLKANVEATKGDQERVEEEREAEIQLVQSLRNILELSRGYGKERTALLDDFRKIKAKADNIKAERDEINENVPPPLEIIEQRMLETYRKLTTIPHDLRMMPNLGQEAKWFSFFFELKAMHSRKVRGNQLHQKYIELLRNQEERVKELDRLSEEKKSVAEDAREEIPDQKANPREIRKLNERIAAKLETIKSHRSELKKMRREIGRLEAYSRVRKKGAKGARGGKKIGPRLDDVKARASSGKSLSIEDMNALLNSGNLHETLSEVEQVVPEKKAEPVKKRKRRSGAARGRRRTLNPEEKEKRSR